jgi:membrane-associated protease RseP (regulator of RpoE activity)
MTAHGRSPLRAFCLSLGLGGAVLAGCGDSDTILALNVELRQSATSARSLVVNVTQPGQSAFQATVAIATKQTDAGIELKSNKFFERLTLPASYSDLEATVSVVAKDMAGADVGTATSMVGVRPAEAVAGYVTIGEDPPPMPAPDAAAAGE